METRGRLYDATQLAHLELHDRVLELLLHVPRGEPAQVAALLGGVAVGVDARELTDLLRACLGLGLGLGLG